MPVLPGPTAGDTSWFVDDRFGLFIHWGTYSLAARHEWVQQRERSPTKTTTSTSTTSIPTSTTARLGTGSQERRHEVLRGHHQAPRGLLPVGLRPDRLQGHPDTWGKDVLRPMVDAFRAEGFKVGFYHSLLDWHHPEFPVDPVHPMRDDLAYRETHRDRDFASTPNTCTGRPASY